MALRQGYDVQWVRAYRDSVEPRGGGAGAGRELRMGSSPLRIAGPMADKVGQSAGHGPRPRRPVTRATPDKRESELRHARDAPIPVHPPRAGRRGWHADPEPAGHVLGRAGELPDLPDRS